jgi:hypothetical protein
VGSFQHILGGGFGDPADTTFNNLTAGEDVFSNITLSTTSTLISGGFDSLGNSYTVKPIAISNVTVIVRKYQSANTGVRPIFKTSFTGNPAVNSTVIVFTGPANNSDFLLSTESLYLYPVFTDSSAYYGFEQVEVGTQIQIASGGTRGNTYRGTTKIDGANKLSGSVTQVSIPSLPGNVNSSSVTDTTANITWTAPADDGIQSPTAYSAANIKGYRINYRNSSLENWKVLVANTGSNALFRVVSGLTPSTYYEVQVAALNSVTDAHNIDYTSITAHVGSRSVTHSFNTIASTNNIKVWDGTAFKKSIIKIWDGAAWIQYPNVRAKVWDGTVFKDLALDS